MESIGVRELRQYASRYLDRVRGGEPIQVTDRGVPVAMLVPAVRDTARERLIGAGGLVASRGPRVLPPPVAGDERTADVLDDLRAEPR